MPRCAVPRCACDDPPLWKSLDTCQCVGECLKDECEAYDNNAASADADHWESLAISKHVDECHKVRCEGYACDGRYEDSTAFGSGSEVESEHDSDAQPIDDDPKDEEIRRLKKQICEEERAKKRCELARQESHRRHELAREDSHRRRELARQERHRHRREEEFEKDRQLESRLSVVVDFANVGKIYGVHYLGSEEFDWHGVRLCVRHLTQEKNLRVVGVIRKDTTARDNNSIGKCTIPSDIEAMCVMEWTPKTNPVTEAHQKDADDEMVIKCAKKRNCRFLANDKYRDWEKEMQDESVRDWLQTNKHLHMDFSFDDSSGRFNIID